MVDNDNDDDDDGIIMILRRPMLEAKDVFVFVVVELGGGLAFC